MPESSLNLLDSALKMEEKGKKYYDQARITCQNELGREIFGLLSGFEVQHMDRIRAIFNSLQQGRGWTGQAASFTPSADMTAVFRKMAREKKEHVQAGTGDVEALGVGLQFESASIKFYQDWAAQASDPTEKKFLELMVAEERDHLNLLSEMHLYHTDPESWYMQMDRVSLDGA
ncbi:MAG: ferritin family protein [Pseudomonadota bacterium]